MQQPTLAEWCFLEPEKKQAEICSDEIVYSQIQLSFDQGIESVTPQMEFQSSKIPNSLKNITL